MQQAPHYNDVAREVGAFLRDRREAFARDGVPAEQLLLDPGFGFGKTLEHNLALFHALPALAELGSPLLVGVSRKSMIGALLGDCPVQERDAGSAIAALLAAQAGARVLRVHDVAGTHDALALYSALTPQAWRGSRQS